jgi:hypothetical protein
MRLIFDKLPKHFLVVGKKKHQNKQPLEQTRTAWWIFLKGPMVSD